MINLEREQLDDNHFITSFGHNEDELISNAEIEYTDPAGLSHHYPLESAPKEIQNDAIIKIRAAVIQYKIEAVLFI